MSLYCTAHRQEKQALTDALFGFFPFSGLLE